MLEHAEVEDHDHADEDLENQDELALRDQVGLAGLVNELRDFPHRRVNGQVLELPEDDHSEREAEHADDEARLQQRATVDALELDAPEIGKDEVCLAARVPRRRLRDLRVSGCRRLRGGQRDGPQKHRHHTEQRTRSRKA